MSNDETEQKRLAQTLHRLSVKEFLTANLAPRGLSRAVAAAYIRVGIGTFDQMVRDRRMPKPKTINRRLVWDRFKLDEAFSALPDEDGEADHPWSFAS